MGVVIPITVVMEVTITHTNVIVGGRIMDILGGIIIPTGETILTGITTPVQEVAKTMLHKIRLIKLLFHSSRRIVTDMLMLLKMFLIHELQEIEY